MSIKPILIRNLLIPYLIVSMSFIGCGGGGGNAAQTASNDQINTSQQLSSTVAEIETEFDKINNEIGAVVTYDEDTGNKYLDYFNDKAIPQLDEALAKNQELETQEANLVAQVTASGGTVALRSDDDDDSTDPQAQIILPLVGAAVILGGIGLALLNFGLKTKARVKAVEDGLQASRDAGQTQAQAFGSNSQLMKQKFNEHQLDLQFFIATSNKGVDYIKGALGRGAELFLAFVDAANNSIEIKDNAHLIGKKKNSSNSNLIQGQSTGLETVYMGSNSGGSPANSVNYPNMPTGLWDFVVFEKGFVRGVVKNVTINTGINNQTVVLNTLEEVTGDDETGGGSSSGSFTIDGFSNIDGTVGTNGADADIQVSGSSSAPTISWDFSQAATLLVSTTGVGSVIYGIVSDQDEDDNIIPLRSPVTYGNYGGVDTVPFGAASNPSPALSSGVQYLITMNTLTAGTASLLFTVN